MSITIFGRFKGDRAGVLLIDNPPPWISVDASYDIVRDELPINIDDIGILTTRGSFRRVEPVAMVTLVDHLRHWWAIRRAG